MEKKIENLMKTLGVSRDEAMQIIVDDEAIDKGADLFPLTEEQKKAVKKAKNSSTKKSVKKKREKKIDENKKKLIADIISGLQNVTDLEIVNDERELTFKYLDIGYKIVLSKPRT